MVWISSSSIAVTRYTATAEMNILDPMLLVLYCIEIVHSSLLLHLAIATYKEKNNISIF